MPEPSTEACIVKMCISVGFLLVAVPLSLCYISHVIWGNLWDLYLVAQAVLLILPHSEAEEGLITGCTDTARVDVIFLMNILNTGSLIH